MNFFKSVSERLLFDVHSFLINSEIFRWSFIELLSYFSISFCHCPRINFKFSIFSYLFLFKIQMIRIFKVKLFSRCRSCAEFLIRCRSKAEFLIRWRSWAEFLIRFSIVTILNFIYYSYRSWTSLIMYDSLIIYDSSIIYDSLIIHVHLASLIIHCQGKKKD